MNTEEIIEGYLGNIEVNSIYQGSELVWPIFGDKYLIGGDFTTFNGSTQNRLVRLNVNGTKDTSFNIGTGFNGTVYALNIDIINQKIYVGGSFTTYNGSTQNRLIRLNMDGSKDTSFNIGTGFDGNIRSIIIDNTNSKIYVGGWFTTFNGGEQKRLVRLNLNGSKDTSFNIGTGFGGGVYALNLDRINQKLYVSGNFQKYIVRLNMNGSLDTSFDVGNGNYGIGFNGAVYTFDIDTINQRIYVAGSFTKYYDYSQIRIAKLKMNGGIDFNIGYTSDGGFEGGPVYAMNIDTINQKIYVGGEFTTYYGNMYRRLIRLNMDGKIDNTFNVGNGLDGYITTPSGILIDNEKNKIYIAGTFTTYNNQQQKYIARLNMDGSLDTSFNVQLNSSAYTILKYTV